MKTISTISELRGLCDTVRGDGATVGFVPTMGFFHAGHVSLMRYARSAHDLVVASIFVNPLQFGENEDLDRYPRDLEGDARHATAAGVDVLFVPSVDEMYPGGNPRTTVHVEGLTTPMCGAARPGHFDGVTTVCAKLFAVVGASTVYMGRKDLQQWLVVRQMAADLNLPVEVVGAPVVREADGLAMSSRNAYLSREHRATAPVLYRALAAGVEQIRAGERRAEAVREGVVAMVGTEPQVSLEYCDVRSVPELETQHRLEGELAIAVAATLGSTRLIDNVVLTVTPAGIEADLGTIVGEGFSTSHANHTASTQ